MDVLQILLLVAMPLISFVAGRLDPRSVLPWSDLGRAMRAAGRRGQIEVNAALREGRAVHDPHLASLAAAVSEHRMREADYRGPLRRHETISIVLLAVCAVGFFALGRDWRPTGIALGVCWLVVVVWLLGLRRLVPTTRDPRGDRLLMGYRENAALAAQTGPASLEHAGVGLD